MERSLMISKIYLGEVTHERFFPQKHFFKYRSYFFKLSLKELGKIENIFFKHNRFSLFSFYNKDHGFRTDEDLSKFALLSLREKIFQLNLMISLSIQYQE
jgi:DUF1365 family protein